MLSWRERLRLRRFFQRAKERAAVPHPELQSVYDLLDQRGGSDDLDAAYKRFSRHEQQDRAQAFGTGFVELLLSAGIDHLDVFPEHDREKPNANQLKALDQLVSEHGTKAAEYMQAVGVKGERVTKRQAAILIQQLQSLERKARKVG